MVTVHGGSWGFSQHVLERVTMLSAGQHSVTGRVHMQLMLQSMQVTTSTQGDTGAPTACLHIVCRRAQKPFHIHIADDTAVPTTGVGQRQCR
jgi:hypothetical protein